MTDNDIIKALECCCKNNNCEGCPLDFLTFSSQCASELAIKSLDLITRQQAEIERLNALVKTKNKLIERLDQSISYAYDRAIKEFAERLKEHINNCHSISDEGEYVCYDCACANVTNCIDNLVKEMVGE